MNKPTSPTDFDKRAVLMLLSVEEMKLVSVTLRSALPFTPVAQALSQRLDDRVIREEAIYLASLRIANLSKKGKAKC